MADKADIPIVVGHPLKVFEAKRESDEFLYACAPMVRYSKLAFRQTVHHFGVDVCWTPMILAKEFNRNTFARDSDFTISTNPLVPQPTTVLQFGANDATELARASLLAAPYVGGVDLNCGCPQSWACGQSLGAALMNRRELVRDMVVETRAALARDGWAVGKDADVDHPRGRSLSVKIRVHDDLRRTMDYLDAVIGHPQDRLVDWVTIHPRTKNMASTTPIRTEALEILTAKYAGTLPILLSGDVFELETLPFGKPADTLPPTFTSTTSPRSLTPSSLSPQTVDASGDDTQAALRPSTTRLSGFMSARGLLSNPALFAGHRSCPWEAVERFMCNVARCPLPFRLVLHHVQDMCSQGPGPDKAALLSKRERVPFQTLRNMAELIDFLDEVVEEKTGQLGGMRRNF